MTKKKVKKSYPFRCGIGRFPGNYWWSWRRTAARPFENLDQKSGKSVNIIPGYGATSEYRLAQMATDPTYILRVRSGRAF